MTSGVRMRTALATAIIVISLSLPAYATEPFIGGVVKETDVAMLFDFVRDAISAAFHGREVAPPAALIERGEAIAQEAKQRGEIAARAAIDEVEREVRESMRSQREERLPGSI